MLCPQMSCPQHLIHGLNAALHDLACDCQRVSPQIVSTAGTKVLLFNQVDPSASQHSRMKLQLIRPT